MAGDPRVGERVYVDIKNAILSGELRVRQRLDIDALAKRFGASATPVRQALAILTVERLVRVGAARGYQVAFWSDRELKDLYAWRFSLARLAAADLDFNGVAPPSSVRPSHPENYAAFMERLETNANPELRRAARAADERLHAALRVETEVLDDASREIAALTTALGRKDRRALHFGLGAYFRRRVAKSALIRAHVHAHAIPPNGE